jgi:arylsulfatase
MIAWRSPNAFYATPRLALALFTGVLPVLAMAQKTKPNIVFILMDNLGYGELGVYGGGITRGAPTPRIDQLAAEGMRLTNFNVEAQCTPSRSAIMTGRFSIRSLAGTCSSRISGRTPFSATAPAKNPRST